MFTKLQDIFICGEIKTCAAYITTLFHASLPRIYDIMLRTPFDKNSLRYTSKHQEMIIIHNLVIKLCYGRFGIILVEHQDQILHIFISETLGKWHFYDIFFYNTCIG